MDLIDESLVIDFTENQKLCYEQASGVLKERYPGVPGLLLLSWSVRRLCKKEICF